MTGVLMVLAGGSVLAGWLSVPKIWTFLPDSFRSFEHWLAPVFATVAHAPEHGEAAHHDTSIEWMLMGFSVLIAVAGIALARQFYQVNTEMPDKIAASAQPLYKLLYNKWYLDEIYDFLFVNGLCKAGGLLMGRFDNRVVDGGVNGAGWLTRFSSTLSIWWDTWIIDGTVRATSFLVKVLSLPVRILQTGQLQTYALFLMAGIIFLFGYYMVGR
jgi:NADH-quinone oxidoreductase subunit L